MAKTENAARLREIAAKVRQVAGAFKEEELHVDWKGWIAIGPLFMEAYEAGTWQWEGSQIGDRHSGAAAYQSTAKYPTGWLTWTTRCTVCWQSTGLLRRE